MSPSSDLESSLAATLDDARRSYAAWRPEVAHYLFERGLRKTGEALGADPARDAILTHVWRLQMESIGTRMFGVSTDAWRDNPAYPDRFFPIVWIDLVPKLLPRLPDDKRLPALIALFNLGENLVTAAPSLGGLVAEALVNEWEAIVAEGVEPVALTALVDLGIVPEAAAPRRKISPSAWRRVVPLAIANVATWEPTLIPGAVGITDEGTIWVADRTRPFALQLAAGGSSVQLVARVTRERVTDPQPLPCSSATLSIGADGSVRAGEKSLGHIDPRGIAGVATGSQGTIVVSRRFSQRVELYVARA
ncbi:MAG: hypothetical protein ACXWUG_32105 [Polyangiales bacterium]